MSRACLKKILSLHIFSKNFPTTFSRKKFLFILLPLFSHRPQNNANFLFLHHTFTQFTFFSRFTPNFLLFIPVNTYAFYFFVIPSLQKLTFITAHFRSSLHILCITAR